MTETEFRSKHSELIEYYQYIEMHLKYICVNLIGKRQGYLFERFEEFQSDTLGKLIRLIGEYQEQNQAEWFTPDDLEVLEALRGSRNYWVHACFSEEYHVSFRNGQVKNPAFAQRLKQDLQDAIDWDEKITRIGHEIERNYQFRNAAKENEC